MWLAPRHFSPSKPPPFGYTFFGTQFFWRGSRSYRGLFAVVLIPSLRRSGTHGRQAVTHPLLFPFPAGRGSAGYIDVLPLSSFSVIMGLLIFPSFLFRLLVLLLPILNPTLALQPPAGMKVFYFVFSKFSSIIIIKTEENTNGEKRVSFKY